MIRLNSSEARKLGLTSKGGPKRGMNKWEAEFDEKCRCDFFNNNILWWGYEQIKFRLADATFYTPDFVVIGLNWRMRAIEIKGFLRDDAAVKFKVAKERFPWVEFEMVRKVKGAWERIR